VTEGRERERVYRRGSGGSTVRAIQCRLSELGYYRGPLDGIFGGGTEAAVKAFQRESGLQVDGKVGPKTRNALGLAGGGLWDLSFEEREIKSVAECCLALTGAFETSLPPPECFAAVAGDFDGQGISFGALQWNIGQGTLQPIFRDLVGRYPELMLSIFSSHLPELEEVLKLTRPSQMNWARCIQDTRNRLHEPWLGMFKTLGRTRQCQALQTAAADEMFQRAVKDCYTYRLRSARAVALFFDIQVQCGGINSVVAGQIRRDIFGLGRREGLSEDELEVKKLRIVANRRAESYTRWREDVRARKLTIANGEGVVHGRHYDLAREYGIGLEIAI